jgi:hypothetical protein
VVIIALAVGAMRDECRAGGQRSVLMADAMNVFTWFLVPFGKGLSYLLCHNTP